MRCLSDPATQIANFYGILCCDCAIGYIATPVNHFLIGDLDETESVTVYHNSAHIPQTKSGITCYDGGTLQSTIMSYMPLSGGEEDDGSECGEHGTPDHSDALEDPDLAYYRHFDTVEHRLISSNSTTMSDTTRSYPLNVIEDDRKILQNATPHDKDDKTIRRCLTRYQSYVGSIKDVEKKKQLVDEYELFKSQYDVNNEEEAEKAEHYRENARNNGYTHSNEKRVIFYQRAIAFTNDLEKKNELKREYRRFCFSIKGGSNTPSTSHD